MSLFFDTWVTFAFLRIMYVTGNAKTIIEKIDAHRVLDIWYVRKKVRHWLVTQNSVDKITKHIKYHMSEMLSSLI